MKKRVLSLFMLVIMLITAIPMGAIATAAQSSNSYASLYGAQIKTGDNSIRFVGIVNDYMAEGLEELGFVITFGVYESDCKVRKVYTSIMAGGQTLEADKGNPESNKKFFTFCLSEVPISAQLEVGVYTVVGGEKTYGKTYTYRYMGNDIVGSGVTLRPNNAVEDSADIGDLLAPVTTFGGMPMSEIKEVAYYDDSLRANAESIAQTLTSHGATGVSVFKGTPTKNIYSIELGCAEDDKRLNNIADGEAVITSSGKSVFAAVKGATFDDKQAAGIVESYIGKHKYKNVFFDKLALVSASAVGNEIADINAISGNIYFKGDTVQDPITYEVGEPITFNIQLVRGKTHVGCEKLYYQIDCDDGKSISGTVDGASGEIKITTVLSSPGYVRVRVTAQDASGTQYSGSAIFEGGAGADIEKLEQSVEEPSDFDEFWATKLAELDAFDVTNASNITMTTMPETTTHYVYDVQIKCVGAMPASGVLTIPKGAAAGSLDAMMVFQAHSNTPIASSPVYKTDAIVFSVNPHGVLNYGQSDSYYTDYGKTIGSFGFNSEQNKAPETSYFYGMIMRDVQAARYLLTRPEYNGEGLIFENGSMGAMQAINVASLIGEDNVKQLTLSYPWLSNFGCAAVGLMGPTWGPPVTPTTENGVATIVEKGTLYFDPVNHAKRITAKVRITSCLGDYICPPSGQTVLYKAFASTDKTMIFKQNATHGYTSPNSTSYVVGW